MSLVDYSVNADAKSFRMIFRARVMVDGRLQHVATKLTTFQARGITRPRAAVLAEKLPRTDLPVPDEEVS